MHPFQTLAEVHKALVDFERDENQIPTSVLLMANFRKSYFRGKFLPILMSQKKTSVTQLFMEKLKDKGKISRNLLEKYQS